MKSGENTVKIEAQLPEDLAKFSLVSEAPTGGETAFEDIKVKIKKKKKPLKQRETKRAAVATETVSVNSTSEPGIVFPNLRDPVLNPVPLPDTFQVGEKITYDVTWLKTKAGELSLEVLPFMYVQNRKVYHFRGEGRTVSLFSSIYEAEDYAESFVDYLGFFPFKFVLHGDETKHIRDGLEVFDHFKKNQYVYIRDDRRNGDVSEEKGLKDMKPWSLDALGTIYYLRMHSFQRQPELTLPVVSSGRQYDANFRLETTENLRVPAGSFSAMKIKVEFLEKKEKKKTETYVWLSKDPLQRMLRFEAKVKVGWIVGVAREFREPFVGHQELKEP